MKLFAIGTKVKNLRKEKNITQVELAKIANISRVTLGKLERGHVGSVSIKTLDLILDALGYEINFEPKDSYGFGIPVFGEFQ